MGGEEKGKGNVGRRREVVEGGYEEEMRVGRRRRGWGRVFVDCERTSTCKVNIF